MDDQGAGGKAPLAFLLLCGFHHTDGNSIETCVPPLDEFPSEWDALPFIALPDGAHKSDKDFVFFLTSYKVLWVSATGLLVF